MTHLRLTHLRIVFHYSIRPPISAQTEEPCVTPYDDFAQNIAHDTDLYPAAAQLLDTMQKLQYVLLTTCGVRRYRMPWKYWHSSKAWRLVEADEDAVTPGCPPDSGRPSCMEISGEEAEAVIDKQELYLRYREEVRDFWKWCSDRS